MPNNIQRAVQFLPFDALPGWKEALYEVEQKMGQKETTFATVESKLVHLKKGDQIKVYYYNQLAYLELMGTIKKIDFVKKKLYIAQAIIDFEDIDQILCST